MSKIKIIADPGSCHLGSLTMAKELIDVASGCGADAIKFQLFKNLPPNIELPIEFINELRIHSISKGIELFFSVWGMEMLNIALNAQCKSVKFSYSQRNSVLIDYACKKFNNVYVSSDVMGARYYDATMLYCVPQYPVLYDIDFDGLFEDRFEGFSSHCLGINQDLRAVQYGARIIEKHIRLDDHDCEMVPDGKFALVPKRFEKLCKLIRIGQIEYKE